MTHLIHIGDIPPKFKVSISKSSAAHIFSQITLENKLLAKLLLDECSSIRTKKKKTIYSYINRNWKSGKRIPVDVLLTLCKLSGCEPEAIEPDISELHYGHNKNPWKTSFPIKLNKDLACVSETIRTEGHIDSKTFQGVVFSNTDRKLLKRVEKALLNLKLERRCFSKILHIYVWLDDDEVKSICDENGKLIEKFTIRNLGKEEERILTFVSSIKHYSKKAFKIELTKKTISLGLGVSKHGRIILNSDRELKTTAFVAFTAYNSVFARFLHHCLHVQTGKKSYEIELPEILKNSDEDILKEIIGIVVSCEGSIGNYSNLRWIAIKMGSLSYLEAIGQILSKFGINYTIRKVEKKLYTLIVSRKKNLVLFYKTFPIYHTKKSVILKAVVNSYSSKKLAHWEADRFYLTYVNKLRTVTAENLASMLSKSHDHIGYRLRRLMEMGHLKRRGGKCYGYYRKRDPYIYSITEKGRKFLNRN